MSFRPRYKPVVHHHQEFADKSVARIKQLFLEQMTYQAIADTLNAENLKTLRGLKWTAENVRQVIHRLRKDMASWYGLAANRARFTPEPVAA